MTSRGDVGREGVGVSPVTRDRHLSQESPNMMKDCREGMRLFLVVE